MSPQVHFKVDGVAPIKRGAESMWGRQLDRVRELRRVAAERLDGVAPAGIDGQVQLGVVIFAEPRDGDLDGFVAGICDALQPCSANYVPHVNAADWADLPEAAYPTNALGIADDRSISTIHAERRAPEGSKQYEVELSW